MTKDKHANGLEDVLREYSKRDGWNVSWIFSLPGLIILYGIFWAQHEILKICMQYFSPKPKDDLGSDSVHCFTAFWQPLQKEKCTGKVKDQWIFQTKEWDLQEREFLFKETTKCVTHKQHKCVNFYDQLVFVQNRVYWKKSLSHTTYWFWAVNSDTFSLLPCLLEMWI